MVISECVGVVSPCAGRVSEVSETINPYAGNTLFSVLIVIDRVWSVKLVFEPGFTDDTSNNPQSDAILINSGEVVEVGDEIGTLMYSENYAHLHYMLMYRGIDVSAYDYSSPSAKATFENIAERSNNTIQYGYDMPNR